MNGPLAGVVVLSLAEQLPGPYATLLMADLGADVILVERPGVGDPARAFPHFFSAISRNKRSVCLNLKSPGDKARFDALVARADVVLEGYAPGTAARLGIDYEALKQVNSRLIYASISGFGQTGPYHDRPAHDISYQAVAGALADQALQPGRTPLVPLGDMSAAMFAAYSVVAALYGREKNGAGTYIDVSMADGLVSWMTPALVPALNRGRQIDVTDSPAYGTFACADGRVLSLSVAHEDSFWRRLCVAVGLPELAELDHAGRVEQTAALRTRLAERIGARNLIDWQIAFDQNGVPWSPVNSIDQVIEDPHFHNRGLFEPVPRADGRVELHVRQPVKFSAYPPRPLRPAPDLGEHNPQILDRAELGENNPAE